VLPKSYYLTLGVTPNESTAGIREAFHEVVKRYHPDRVGTERSVFFARSSRPIMFSLIPSGAGIMIVVSIMPMRE